MKGNHTYIDLFAGCGGLSLGLNHSQWKGLFAIEKSPHAFQTLEYNLINKKEHFEWPKWLPQQAHDINVVIKRMIIPMGRSSSHIQIRSSEQECLIPLHIGSRHVQKSGGSIHILRKTFLPYHTQQKNK